MEIRKLLYYTMSPFFHINFKGGSSPMFGKDTIAKGTENIVIREWRKL